MLASDIIARLAAQLPKFTDKFTTNISVTDLSITGTTVEATTDVAHGLAVNQQVNIVGAKSPIGITALSRAGTVGTMTTLTKHDLTTGANTSVEITSAVAEFTGTFDILTIPDRYTVTFKMPDSGPVSGLPASLLNGFSVYESFNGLVKITSIPDVNMFTYETTATPPIPFALGTIVAKTRPRISGAITEERVIQAYTKQQPADWWAFVILGDVAASKSRRIGSDAVDHIQRGNDYRQQIIQPFNVLVMVPARDQIAARLARDECEQLFRPLCQSLLFAKFDSGLSVGAHNPVTFVTHGTAGYDTAIYWHVYTFETIADITFEDTAGYSDDVAFRDIELSILPNIGTQDEALTVGIELDG